ncbi:hypothetical protein FQN57_005495 [Myotisia sp. PD_48]|nr:hypothetical protein FQN57_005495 [Myotisia sp. PD_48]
MNQTNNQQQSSQKSRPWPRGRHIEGVWYCDCEPIFPAKHFQTKNGGKNHGRWFYTCSKPQANRCGFFLWDDEAIQRAAASQKPDPTQTSSQQQPRSGFSFEDSSGSEDNLFVTAVDEFSPPQKNSEYANAPRTPSTNRVRDALRYNGLLTPDTSNTNRKRDGDNVNLFQHESPTKRGKAISRQTKLSFTKTNKSLPSSSILASGSFSDDPDLNDSHNPPSSQTLYPSLSKYILQLSGQQPSLDFSTTTSSTNKQTPTTQSTEPESILLPEPPLTPTPAKIAPPRFHSQKSSKTEPLRQQHCQLVSDTLSLLETHHIRLTPDAKDDLVSLLDLADLRTLGITKGRDISRAGIKKRDEQIKALQARIEVLEVERESWRSTVLNQRDRRQNER